MLLDYLRFAFGVVSGLPHWDSAEHNKVRSTQGWPAGVRGEVHLGTQLLDW